MTQKSIRPFMTLSSSSSNAEEHDFKVEEVSLKDVVAKVPTPFYITSLSAIESRVKSYQKSLKKHFPSTHVYYALKANWAEPIVKTVQESGAGFDIVSLGELRHLLQLGTSPELICFAGVGKTPQEIEEAIKAQVGILNVEHVGELHHALLLLKEIPSTTRLALRLNPCLQIDTHPHLRTGALDSKFGLLDSQILKHLDSIGALLSENSALNEPLKGSVCGLHIHVGSQLLSGELFSQVVKAVVDLSLELRKREFTISHLDFGGGLGVPLHGVPADGSDIEKHMDLLSSSFVEAVKGHDSLQKMWGANFENCQICVEPGRSIAASSTAFVTRVLYTRENSEDHRFAYVDGGMNDFPRPSIYQAAHDVVVGPKIPEGKLSDAVQKATKSAEGLNIWGKPVQGGKGFQIVGPVCESGDVLARDSEIEKVSVADSLVFLEAGAYCRSMASEYNLRKLPAAVFVQGSTVIHQ